MAATGPSAAAIEHSRLFSKQHSDGGWGLVPIQSRIGRFKSFKVSEFEPVTGFENEWKYTPVKLINDLLDGELDGYKFPIEVTSTAESTVDWVERSNPTIGSVGVPEEKGSANAWSQIAGAYAITVQGESQRIEISRHGEGDSKAAHLVITAKPGSKGVVILRNFGPTRVSENIEIDVQDEAELTVVSIQQWQDSAVQLATQFAKLGHDSKLKNVVISLGGGIIRLNTNANLAGQGSDVELYGVYFADSNQHLEHQVFVNHEGANTKSRVNYRGALNGEGARTVWVGDVLIRPTAISTDSYEENRNLLLSEGARADSVPNLEIETGDILGAGHASASGRFDDEQLFYLQARGIPEAEARKLVVKGFLAGLIQKIGLPELEDELENAIEAELNGQAG